MDYRILGRLPLEEYGDMTDEDVLYMLVQGLVMDMTATDLLKLFKVKIDRDDLAIKYDISI